MKKFLALTIPLIIISGLSSAFCYTKQYIKNSKGQTTGYTRTYSDGTVKQYNKKGGLEYTYKQSSNGKTTKYSKTGKKLETYK